MEELQNNETVENSRNSMQKIAMAAIYDVLTYIEMDQAVDVESIISSLTDLPYEESDYFVKATVIRTIEHYAEIVAVLEEHMIKWKFSRLNRVEQAILLLSYAHFFYVDKEVDKTIVINIAVKLSKAYLDDKDYKFVNAILDKVLVR